MARNFEFPTSYGVLAGQEWGSPSGFPWLFLHGWMDNCGSFEGIAPLFPEGHRIICIEWPGNGLSSSYPEGMMYNHADLMLSVRRVVAHFGLTRFGILAHSMGGALASLYAGIHPDQVVVLIMLDIIKLRSRAPSNFIEYTRQAVDEHMATEEHYKKNGRDGGKPMSYETAKKKLMEGHNFQHKVPDALTSLAADCILRRGLRKVGDDAFVYTRDARQRNTSLYGYQHESLMQSVRNISCPTLILNCSRSGNYELDTYVESALAAMNANPRMRLEVVRVDGTHHVHLNDPERAMKPIQAFIQRNQEAFKERSKL